MGRASWTGATSINGTKGTIMQISPNVMLAGKYVAAGATLAVGYHVANEASDNFKKIDSAKDALAVAGGVAAAATGGVMAFRGYQQLGNLGLASGSGWGMAAKSIAMLGAGLGAAYLVGKGLD